MTDQEKKLLEALSDIEVDGTYYVDLEDNGDFHAPLCGVERKLTNYLGLDADKMDEEDPNWYADSYAVGNAMEKCVNVIYMNFCCVTSYGIDFQKVIELPKEVGKKAFKKLYASSPNEFALDVITF